MYSEYAYRGRRFQKCNCFRPPTDRSRDLVHAQTSHSPLTQGRTLFWQITQFSLIVEPWGLSSSPHFDTIHKQTTPSLPSHSVLSSHSVHSSLSVHPSHASLSSLSVSPPSLSQYSENGSGYPRFWNRFCNYRTGSLEPVPTSNHYLGSKYRKLACSCTVVSYKSTPASALRTCNEKQAPTLQFRDVTIRYNTIEINVSSKADGMASLI